MTPFFIWLLFLAGPPLTFYFIGAAVERSHLRSLAEREAALAHIVTTNLKEHPLEETVSEAVYVDGQAVIGSDYFKTFAAGLRNLFGGEIRSIESLMIRARREALVRMLDQANAASATHVLNVRLETSTIGRGQGGNKGLITAEIHAYGTAVTCGQAGGPG